LFVLLTEDDPLQETKGTFSLSSTANAIENTAVLLDPPAHFNSLNNAGDIGIGGDCSHFGESIRRSHDGGSPSASTVNQGNDSVKEEGLALCLYEPKWLILKLTTAQV
jgi:hypothetical protein